VIPTTTTVAIAYCRAKGRNRRECRQNAWSEYIRLHYQMTGSLAPGCDAKQFFEVLDKYLKEEGRP